MARLIGYVAQRIVQRRLKRKIMTRRCSGCCPRIVLP